MPERIVVTGCAGLVGTSLVARLRRLGHLPVGIDLRADRDAWRGDVRHPEQLRHALTGVDGIVHLAAISRVVWAERDPTLCWATNVEALRSLLDIALDAPRQPWVIFASSREVYGQPATLPATETAPLTPVNVYGRAKAAGETLCDDATRAGLRVAIVRLSNVYGSPQDHRDRVVPGFVRAALAGDALRVEGAENTFDFTHIDDVVDGLVAIIEAVRHRGAVPPLHLLTGVPTSLSELASLAVRLSGSGSSIVEAPARTFDVARFFGDPARAHAILGWQAHVSVQVGVARLISQMRTDRVHDVSAATMP
jgi:nucleoside-diphosphate-sugar epimerase